MTIKYLEKYFIRIDNNFISESSQHLHVKNAWSKMSEMYIRHIYSVSYIIDIKNKLLDTKKLKCDTYNICLC